MRQTLSSPLDRFGSRSAFPVALAGLPIPDRKAESFAITASNATIMLNGAEPAARHNRADRLDGVDARFDETPMLRFYRIASVSEPAAARR